VDETDIYRELTRLFRETFGDSTIRVTPELTAKDVAGWDSLSHLRLILSAERAFKIRFSTSEIGKLKKVGDLATLIQARLAKSGMIRAGCGATEHRVVAVSE